jgi:hypothetical protein
MINNKLNPKVDFVDEIYLTIRNKNGPVELWEIIANIDETNKLIISYKEITSGLTILFDKGLIKQNKLKYYLRKNGEPQEKFELFSFKIYRESCIKYRNYFSREYKKR